VLDRGLRHLVPSVTFIAACSVAALQIAHHQHQVWRFCGTDHVLDAADWAFGHVGGELSRLTERLVNAEKLLVLLEKTPRTQDALAARPFKFLEGAVEFENISFSYDGKRQVTNGVTFRAAPGKRWLWSDRPERQEHHSEAPFPFLRRRPKVGS